MLDEKGFLDLVRDNGGIEITLGFRGNEDHFIGGTGDRYWYFVKKGAKEDYYVCCAADSGAAETHYTRKRKVLRSEPAPAGKTMELILSELAAGQKEIEEDGRAPVNVEAFGRPCSHYSFAFGERAYKISDEYGVTVERSELDDESAGFRLRNIVTGEDVAAPAEN